MRASRSFHLSSDLNGINLLFNFCHSSFSSLSPESSGRGGLQQNNPSGQETFFKTINYISFWDVTCTINCTKCYVHVFITPPHSQSNGFYWAQQCSWTLTPANTMQVSNEQSDNRNRKKCTNDSIKRLTFIILFLILRIRFYFITKLSCRVITA